MKTLLTVLIVLFFCLSLEGQNIKDLSFISGKGVTTTEWGDRDEYWSEPMSNCMTCTFRCVKEGKVVFYEFITIVETSRGKTRSIPTYIRW